MQDKAIEKVEPVSVNVICNTLIYVIMVPKGFSSMMS